MPKLIQPVPRSWPHDVEVSVTALFNRARCEMIRHLVHHGPCTRGDIVANVACSEPSVAKHLLILEDAGVISADVAPGRRQGRAPRYTANEARIKYLIGAHRRYLLGPFHSGWVDRHMKAAWPGRPAMH